MANIANSILHGCFFSDQYMRGVLPHIHGKYFDEPHQKLIYEKYTAYVEKYNKLATTEAIKIALNECTNISDDEYKKSLEELTYIESESGKQVDSEWLTDETEKWCKSQDLIQAIRRAIMVVQGEDKEMSVDGLPELLQQSLAISFDTSIGHDYLEDHEQRFDFYNEDLERVKFDIEILNKITKGGTPNKTLNIIMGGTGGFKSGTMCHFASANLFDGKDVLYITMEMSEERIAERIDANMLDVSLDDLKDLEKSEYKRRIESVRAATNGRMIIKEYPTASAHAGHFRQLLRELELKKNFKPQVIYIDYLNICASSRCKGGENSYTLVKSIAEELRGLAVEFNVPIWSATQTNRSGYGNSDVGLENTSESFGLPATADLFLAAITTPELDEQGLIMYKQLKNRFGDISSNEKFVVGIERDKMRLHDTEDSAQNEVNLGTSKDKEVQAVFDSAASTPNFGSKTNTEVESDFAFTFND